MATLTEVFGEGPYPEMIDCPTCEGSGISPLQLGTCEGRRQGTPHQKVEGCREWEPSKPLKSCWDCYGAGQVHDV